MYALIIGHAFCKEITINTPYLLGDKIEVYDIHDLGASHTGTVTGICIDENTVFYRVEANFTTYYLTLKQIQEMQPSVEIKG
jgi:hypothetical protein